MAFSRIDRPMTARLRTVSRLVALFTVPLVANACGSDVGDSTSDLQHDIGKPVRAKSSFQWATLQSATFDSAVLRYDSTNANEHPEIKKMIARAERWVELIDSRIREAHPEQMANVPKPQARVIPSSSPNAFVASAFVCYDVGVRFPSGFYSTDRVLIDVTSGTTIRFPGEMECVKSVNTAELYDALEDFNQQAEAGRIPTADCSFSASSDAVSVSSGCERADTGSIGSARGVVLRQIANWITITTGLFETMEDEGAFAAVIGHELAHYYRAHGMAWSDEYGYYYTVDDVNPSTKPVPDPSLKEFGDKVYAASQIAMEVGRFASVEGAELSGHLFFAAGDLAHKACNSGSSGFSLGGIFGFGSSSSPKCSDSCKTIAGLNQSTSFIRDMGYYPLGQPKKVELYREFEAAAKKCLAGLKYGSEGLGEAAVIASVTKPKWLPLASALDKAGKQRLTTMLKALTRVYQGTPSGETVLDALMSAEKDIQAGIDFMHGFLKEAHQKRLGQFTAEQEADELAAEWLNDLGVGAEAVADAFIFLGKGGKSRLGGYLVGGKDCMALRNNGWKDANGDDIFVPIGDYAEIHHSPCFRAYNAHREIAAHGYSPERGNVQLGDLTWQEIRMAAASIRQQIQTGRTSIKPFSMFARSDLALSIHAPERTCHFSNAHKL